MISILLALLIALPQEEKKTPGPVETFLADFERERRAARTQDEYNKAVDKCLSRLESYVQDNPKADDAPAGLAAVGDIYNHIGKADKAEANYKRIIDEYPKATEVPPAILSIAELNLRLEKDKQAAEYCDRFLRDYKDHDSAAYARLFLSLTKLYRGDVDGSIRELQTIRKSVKDDALKGVIATQLAVVHHLAGQSKESQEILEEMILRSKDEKQSAHLRRLLSGYLLVGTEAPDFKAEGFSLKEHRGSVVVLYFFYSNSSLTEGELNFLKELHDKMKEKPVKIVGISVDPIEREYDIFKRVAKVPWTLIRDGNRFEGKIARKYNVSGLPHLMVVDKKGMIRFFNVSGRDLRIAVKKLLD